MKDNRITIRLSETEKEQVLLEANKLKMNLSQYVSRAINEKVNNTKLTEAQEDFINLFDVAFKKSNDIYHKKEMNLLNKIDFNTKLLLEILDLFMFHVSVPNDRKNIIQSLIEHPITEVSREKLFKDIRTNRHQKDLIDE